MILYTKVPRKMFLILIFIGSFTANTVVFGEFTECLNSQLLLRHEDQLRSISSSSNDSTKLLQEMTELMRQLLHEKKSNKSETGQVNCREMSQYQDLTASVGHLGVPNCSWLFSPVGDSCLLLALGEKLTFAAARLYCQGIGGDLAVFKDANHYADTLNYIRGVNGENAAINVWIGGSDEAIEGHWVWITEELMPRGPPFWGSTDGYNPEPKKSDRNQNCAGLFHPDRYYVHDFSCAGKQAPLCQMIPA